MAFVDSVTIEAAAGRGGHGVVRWLREKGRPRGGPCGGDGGRGGDVVLEGVRDLAALASYRHDKQFAAANGQDGGYNNKHGADGAPVVLRVPVGTLARVAETGREVELMKEGEQVTILSGGAGGFGNAHFKSSTNQNPFESTKGKPGEAGSIELELKLMADAGFIGLPSAGKSSLLNALTRAQAKVGAYPFTTLEPNLGDFHGHILADIPGLIEGASAGRGLGSRFLKHVERTGILIHLVSVDQENIAESYTSIRKELEAFGRGLSEKKEVVVLSKVDLLGEEEVERQTALLSQVSGAPEVLTVSVNDPVRLKAFADRLSGILAAL